MLVRMTSTSGKVMLGQCTARFLQVRDAIKFCSSKDHLSMSQEDQSHGRRLLQNL